MRSGDTGIVYWRGSKGKTSFECFGGDRQLWNRFPCSSHAAWGSLVLFKHQQMTYRRYKCNQGLRSSRGPWVVFLVYVRRNLHMPCGVGAFKWGGTQWNYTDFTFNARDLDCNIRAEFGRSICMQRVQAKKVWSSPSGFVPGLSKYAGKKGFLIDWVRVRISKSAFHHSQASDRIWNEMCWPWRTKHPSNLHLLEMTT